MFKKIFKYTMMSVLFLLTIFSTQTVHAEQYTGTINEAEWISNIYIKKVKGGYTKYEQGRFLRRGTDNQFLYCIQPLVGIDNSQPYNIIRDDYESVLNFTEAQWDRITLLAHYGYQYNENGYNHSDSKWYVITQVMIWRTTNPEYDIYFTDTLNGNRVSKFESEMAEMESLLANHYTTPNLQNNITLPIGSSTTLTDSNNVLSKFTISSTNNVSASINGNQLTITANSVGNGKVTLEKKSKSYEIPPLVYASPNSQNLMAVGSFDPVYARLNLTIIGGRISITKSDSCGSTPSDASLAGAVYGIYDLDGTKITEMTTNANGEATSDYLPRLGKFIVKEIKASNNYLLDSKSYEVELTTENTKDNIPVHINVKENRKAKISLIKEDSKTGNKSQGEATLKGAIYDIFDINGNRVGSMTTDENGKAVSGYLPSTGTFTIKEVKASTGYNLDTNTYTIVVTEDNTCTPIPVNSKEKVITNTYEYTKLYAKADTGFMTPEPNATFIILNNKKEQVAEFITDENGKFKTTLPYGHYTLRQTTSTYGFNKMEDYHFEIKEQIDKIIYKNVSNSEIVAKLRLVKVDSETKEVIKRANIKFKIFDVKNNDYVCQTITYPTRTSYCVFETDKNGEFTTPYELHSGTYRIEEVDQKIDGYLWNKESHEFIIDDNSNLITDSEYGIIFDTKFENHQVKGKITINKSGEKLVLENDSYSYKIESLKGIKFALYAKKDIIINDKVVITKGTKVAEKETSSDGSVIFDNLYLGEYYAKEVSTLDYLVLDEKLYDFNLKYKDQYTPVVEESKTIINYYKKGKLEFSKEDLTTGEGIPNTEIEIYHIDEENDNERVLVFSGLTDKNGNIIIDNLFTGKFIIIEKNASTGYRLSDEEVSFEIKENGDIVKAKMTNEKITSTLKIHKVDEEQNPVEGVVIGMYDLDGNLLYERTTDENGDIEIVLEYGSYYYQEISTLEHLKINDEKVYFDITEDGEVIQKTLVNEFKEIEVPNTESNDYTVVIISFIMTLGLGIVAYGLSKIKKNNKK